MKTFNEFITEISTTLTKKYLNKAIDDHDNNLAAIAIKSRNKRKYSDSEIDDHVKITNKRASGIQKAVDKISGKKIQ